MDQQLCEFGPAAASCLLLAHPFTTPLQTAHLLQIKLIDSKVWLQTTQQQLVVSLFKHSVSPPAQESLDTRTKEIRCDTTSYMLLLFR